MRLRNHVQGVEVWAGADVSMVDVMWMQTRRTRYAMDRCFSITAEPGEESRLRMERFTEMNTDDTGDMFLSSYMSQRATGDVVIFTDDDHLLSSRRNRNYFRLYPTTIEADAIMAMATAPWSELVDLFDESQTGNGY